jgi:hypothetical protein
MRHGTNGFGADHLRFGVFVVPGAVPRPFWPRAPPMSGSRTIVAVLTASLFKNLLSVQTHGFPHVACFIHLEQMAAILPHQFDGSFSEKLFET